MSASRKMKRVGACLIGSFSVALFVLTFANAAAQQRPDSLGASPAQSSNSSATQAPKAPTLADFAWLEGSWQGNWGPRTAEQVWMSPKANVMVGTFRLVEDDKALVLELYTLIQKPDGIEFHFRHFTPELATWEKSDPKVLTLENVTPTQAVFVNSVDGQPKRSLFTRIDQDTYVARSEIVPESGDTQVVEITYHRQNTSSNSAQGAHHKPSKNPH